MTEALLTTRDAMGFFKCSRATFCRLQKRGGFPRPVRLGARCLRWRISELVAFAEASQHAADGTADRVTGSQALTSAQPSQAGMPLTASNVE